MCGECKNIKIEPSNIILALRCSRSLKEHKTVTLHFWLHVLATTESTKYHRMYMHKHLLSIPDSTLIRNTTDGLGCLISEHQTSAVSEKRDSGLVGGMLTLKNSNDQQYTRKHAGKWLSNYKLSVQSASELVQFIIGAPGWTRVSAVTWKRVALLPVTVRERQILFSFSLLSIFKFYPSI